MVERNGIRAFSDPKYDYYELRKSMGGVIPAGAIFVHDFEDGVLGSPALGCLKLCWTKDGGCYGCCANTVILHADFRKSDMFRLAQKGEYSKVREIDDELLRLQRKQSELCQEINQLKSLLKK